ncbi:MAG TPA: hypothetical protein VGC99_22820 [Candidatus Tectomicrobia bacterium]
MPEPQLRRGTCDRQAEEYGDRESPPEAYGASEHASSSERGKATDQGKGLTEGHRPHRTLAPDTGGSAARQPTARRGIADKAKADKPHRVRALYRCLNVELLLECWGDLNTAAASGVDGVTWQASAAKLPAKVEAGVERLQQKRYRAKLRRRRCLPQGNGHERP